MNFNWLLRFRPAAPAKRKLPPPEVSKTSSDADELAIEWISLSREKMTASRISQILEAAESGSCQEQAALVKMMTDRDPIIGAHLQTRMLAVLGCEWRICSDDGENGGGNAEEAVKILKKAKIYDLMRHLLNAIPTGYAGSMIRWADGGANILGFEHVHPSNWIFDAGGNPGLYTSAGEKSLSDFHPNQFVFHVHRMQPGIPSVGGLLRSLAWVWLFKRNAWRDRARFIEKFGIPFMVAKISESDFKNDAERNRILAALRGIGADGVAVTVEGSEIENVSPSGQSSNADFHQFCKDIDDVYAFLILGQTGTSGGTPGKLGNETAQENVRMDILEADCRALMETITTQVVDPLRIFKWGEEAPELSFVLEYEPGEDMQAKATLVKTLKDAGFSAKRDWIEKEFDIPMDETPAAPPPQFQQFPGQLADFADSRTSQTANLASREEFVSRLTENTVARLFKSPETMQEFYAPVRQEIKNAFRDIDPEDPEIIEKFRARMQAFFDKFPAIYEAMDSNELEKALQGSMLSALAVGYAQKKTVTEAFFDANQPRNSNGEWTAVGSYAVKEFTPSPPDKLSPDAIREANAAGLRHRDGSNYWSYRTPVLQCAYDLGQNGVDLKDAPIVKGIRYGKAPESGISTNFQSQTAEKGLSLAQEYGKKEIGSSVWFAERKAYEYRGIKVGVGSDGETLILPLHVENLD